MKILLFGGSGFVGGYLEKELMSYNHDVFIADIVKKQKNNYYNVDITSEEEVIEIIKTLMPDCIVNLAGLSSVEQSWKLPSQTIRINLIGTINILEAVRKECKKCKVLLIGSSEEYAPSNEKTNENSPLQYGSPYSISKIVQEEFARIYREKYGLNIILTRTFNHTGVGQGENFVIPSFIHQVKSKDEIEVGNLKIIRDIGDVRDMVYAYRLLIENKNNDYIYNVGSGSCYSLEEILNYIINLSDKKIAIHIDKTRIRPIDNNKTLCDNVRIRNEYGWEPKNKLLDTIKEMYNSNLY